MVTLFPDYDFNGAYNCSAYDSTVAAKGKAIVLTDLSIAVPEGCYGRVAPRSGLAAKNFIDVGGVHLFIKIVTCSKVYIF